RLLMVQIVDQQLATGCRPVDSAGKPVPERHSAEDPKRLAPALAEFRNRWEGHWPKTLRAYDFRTIKAQPGPGEVPDSVSMQRLKEFQADPNLQDNPQLLLSQGKSLYYGAVRAGKTCLACHQQVNPDLQEGGLLAVIKIEVPTESIA